MDVTILQLAETIIGLTGSNSKIELLPAREDDPINRDPDISLAKEKLGWEPSIPLEEGLRQTVAYFEKLLGW